MFIVIGLKLKQLHDPRDCKLKIAELRNPPRKKSWQLLNLKN